MGQSRYSGTSTPSMMTGMGEKEPNTTRDKSLNDVLEDMKKMLRSGNQQLMLTVSVPEAVLPEL